MSYRPTPPSPHMREGTCRKVTGYAKVRGGGYAREVICGKPFTGSPARKYCDEHSPNIKYRGKS